MSEPKCEHTPLYATDYARGGMERMPCYICQRDAARAEAASARAERDEANVYATRMDKTVDVLRESNRHIATETAKAIAAWLDDPTDGRRATAQTVAALRSGDWRTK